MPRYSFSTSALKGAAPGLGNLAAAIAGAGRTGQDAYDREMQAQSRIGQAIAAAQANQAKAARDQREAAILDGRQEMFREQVAAQSGVNMPTVDAYRATLRGEAPQVSMGPPTEEGDMGVGSFKAGAETSGKLAAAIRQNLPLLFNMKDINPENWAAADKTYQEAAMQRQAVDGSMSPDQTGRAMALLKATPLFKIPEGYTGNQFTGGIDIQSPVNATRQGYIGAQTQERKAAAAENYAQAANARASAAKSAAATPSASGGRPRCR